MNSTKNEKYLISATLNKMQDLLNIPPASHERIQNYIQGLRDLQARQIRARESELHNHKAYALKRKLEVENMIKKEILDQQTKIREADALKQFYVPGEPQFFVALLLRSKISMPAKLKKVCELMRLEKINTLVILKNNESNRNMVRVIKDYVAFGFISFDLLRELVVKRGKGRVFDKHRHSFNLDILSRNMPVNQHNLFLPEREMQKTEMLRQKAKHTLHNITPTLLYNTFSAPTCIDDLCQHLYFGTDSFKVVNNFLAPFRLNCPKGGFKRLKSRHFVDNGILGNWFYEIEGLIRKMIDWLNDNLHLIYSPLFFVVYYSASITVYSFPIIIYSSSVIYYTVLQFILIVLSIIIVLNIIIVL